MRSQELVEREAGVTRHVGNAHLNWRVKRASNNNADYVVDRRHVDRIADVGTAG